MSDLNAGRDARSDITGARWTFHLGTLGRYSPALKELQQYQASGVAEDGGGLIAMNGKRG